MPARWAARFLWCRANERRARWHDEEWGRKTTYKMGGKEGPYKRDASEATTSPWWKGERCVSLPTTLMLPHKSGCPSSQLGGCDCLDSHGPTAREGSGCLSFPHPPLRQAGELCKGTNILKGRRGSILKHRTTGFSTTAFYQTIIYPWESRVLHWSKRINLCCGTGTSKFTGIINIQLSQ